MTLKAKGVLGNVTSSMRTVGNQVLQLFLPARCQLCDNPADTRFEFVFCADCGSDWPSFTPACRICGRPDAQAQDPCADCTAELPPFRSARALTLYEDKVIEAIHGLKYQGRRGLAPVLGCWMADALPSLLGDVDYRCVIPIPMHWRRRWWRGYNQAELLAAPVAARLNAPLELDIMRGRLSQRQARLGLDDRRRNMAQAFRVPSTTAKRIQGGHLLIVDDVYTTGATTRACAQCLVEAGATQVDVLTLARTP